MENQHTTQTTEDMLRAENAALRQRIIELEQIASRPAAHSYPVGEQCTESHVPPNGVNFSILIEHNVDPIMVIQDGIIQYANPAAEAMFERTREELLTSDLGIPFIANTKTEVDILGKKGRHAVAEMWTVTIVWEGQPAYLATFRDITERKQMENNIRSNLQFVNTLLDTIPSPVFYKDTHGTYLGCNRVFAEDILGLAKEIIAGRSIHELALVIPSDLATVYTEKDQLLFDNPGIQMYESRVQCADASIRDFFFFKSTFTDSKGAVAGIIGVMLDITKLKQTERDLHHARNLAEAATRAKSEFLANISHEIRTPLHAIIGMTTLLNYTMLTEEQYECVQSIQTSSDVLLGLVNDILDFSSLESGELTIDQQPFNLESCIDDAFNVIQPQAEAKHLTMSYTCETRVPTLLCGDMASVRRVLINLLSNSVKFTEHGGVSVTISQQSPLGSSPRQPNKEQARPVTIRVSVQDTGIGIPQSARDRLFVSFSQVDASSTRKHGGVGLGLAISKQLVELMGGTIWVESTEGKGSTFHFTFCAETLDSQTTSSDPSLGTKSQPPASLALAVSPSKTLDILLADDNLFNQKVARRLLERMGYHVDVACNGIETLEALNHHEYDVVLMDMHMPDMKGTDISRIVQQDFPQTQRPWIVGLTTQEEFDEHNKNRHHSGMDDYLHIPVQVHDLRAVMGRVRRKTEV